MYELKLYNMKKIFFSALIVSMIIFITACDHGANTTTTTSQVVASGSWKISLFTDSGNDETADFNGYNFVFNIDGTLSAIKNGITQAGSWIVNESSKKFNINLGPKDNSNQPLGELTDDWLILSRTNTEIRLTDNNPSRNEFLTFVKN